MTIPDLITAFEQSLAELDAKQRNWKPRKPISNPGKSTLTLHSATRRLRLIPACKRALPSSFC
jgi:hypothetical protein